MTITGNRKSKLLLNISTSKRSVMLVWGWDIKSGWDCYSKLGKLIVAQVWL